MVVFLLGVIRKSYNFPEYHFVLPRRFDTIKFCTSWYSRKIISRSYNASKKYLVVPNLSFVGNFPYAHIPLTVTGRFIQKYNSVLQFTYWLVLYDCTNLSPNCVNFNFNVRTNIKSSNPPPIPSIGEWWNESN